MDSEPPTARHYIIVRFPTNSPHLAELVTKYRDTKLAALKNDPGAFVQRYDIESRLPLSVWHTRLTTRSTTLVCVATDKPALDTEEALLVGEWVGMEAVLGPLPFEEYHTAFAAASPPVPQAPDPETRWHVYDLYVSPTHRGHGIAGMLREGLVALIAQEAASLGAKAARMRLIVNPKNTWVVDWDRRCGFEKHVMVTLKEGFIANGMEESVAQDTGSTEQLRALWETRYGLCMERLMDVS
jgi:ribosomal protein S18 acetylase RimI-like enzyme